MRQTRTIKQGNTNELHCKRTDDVDESFYARQGLMLPDLLLTSISSTPQSPKANSGWKQSRRQRTQRGNRTTLINFLSNEGAADQTSLSRGAACWTEERVLDTIELDCRLEERHLGPTDEYRRRLQQDGVGARSAQSAVEASIGQFEAIQGDSWQSLGSLAWFKSEVRRRKEKVSDIGGLAEGKRIVSDELSD